MKALKIMVIMVLALLVSLSNADVVTYPLDANDRFFDEWNGSWTAQFDVGTVFSEITDISIKWNGCFMGGREIPVGTNAILPAPIYLESYLVTSSSVLSASAKIEGGEYVYPHIETFDVTTPFELYVGSSFNDWCNGKGEVGIYVHMGKYGEVFEFGYAFLNDVALQIEGTIVPEPCTILLLVGGVVYVSTFSTKRKKE